MSSTFTDEWRLNATIYEKPSQFDDILAATYSSTVLLPAEGLSPGRWKMDEFMTPNDTVLDPQSEIETPKTPQCVLIVDDDASQAEVLSIRLAKQGFDTLTADTGRKGLRLAQTTNPNLVLLDLRLPDVDGLDICQELADDARTCGIPVIILSGMERPDIIRRSREAGCRYYVRKPYDPNALLLLVENAINECSSW